MEEALDLYVKAINIKNSYSFTDCQRIIRAQSALGQDASAARATLSRLEQSLGGESYAARRDGILQTLDNDSPAQQELMVRYEQAYAEGLRLAALRQQKGKGKNRKDSAATEDH